MFDIGWMELMVIGVVALIVVGPKDLPGMFRTVGKYVGKARSMAREFQRSMEQAADESGFKEATDSLKGLDNLGLNSATTSARNYAKSMVMDDDGGDPGAIAEDPTGPKPAAAKPAADEPAKAPSGKPAKTSAKKPAKAAAKKPAARAAAKPRKPAAKPKAAARKPAAKPRKPAKAAAK